MANYPVYTPQSGPALQYDYLKAAANPLASALEGYVKGKKTKDDLALAKENAKLRAAEAENATLKLQAAKAQEDYLNTPTDGTIDWTNPETGEIEKKQVAPSGTTRRGMLNNIMLTDAVIDQELKKQLVLVKQQEAIGLINSNNMMKRLSTAPVNAYDLMTGEVETLQGVGVSYSGALGGATPAAGTKIIRSSRGGYVAVPETPDGSYVRSSRFGYNAGGSITDSPAVTRGPSEPAGVFVMPSPVSDVVAEVKKRTAESELNFDESVVEQ